MVDRTELEKIPEYAPLEFGNNVYRIEFDTRHSPGPYGHRYHFYLKDAVGNVPEFVVYWENFEACVSLPFLSPALSFHLDLLTMDTQHRKAAQSPSAVQTQFPPYLCGGA